MSKKSVVFIEPTGNKTNVFDNYMKLPLMGSLYLGTILKEHGYDVRIFNENIIGREVDPFEVKADVYCITALSVSANRARVLASQFKETYPDAKVIVGGIHASLIPEEFAEVADHVVIGEAEEIIVDVVEGKYKDKVIHGSKLADLEKLPFVDYSLIEGLENVASAPIMTSRGCPFDCNFCSVTKVFGKKFRKLSAKRVVAEVENALAYFSHNSIFFYDDNFTADRKRISEMCDLIIEKGIEITWAAQVRSDLARDPELIDKMTRAGLTWVFIGFESINDDTLKAFHKSQTRADIEKAVRTLHEHGVNIHGMFMMGEDHDTPENIADTVQFAIDNEIDTVQFMMLTPLPGTVCFDEIVKDGRLFHTNWDYYNGMFVVFQPKSMSALTLTRAVERAYRQFYSFRRTLADMLYLFVSVFLDALVWNFRRAKRHGMDALFIRGAARFIVSRHAPLNEAYVKFLGEIERQRALGPE
ncbi:MAG: B12-binding domain-containing radical SAM protein [Planctomycetota bacterium]|jgi:radical SAM superfamily enzyme YgiQ (UPF0313 family)